MIPSVCAVAVAAMAGTAADHLHANGMSLTTVRKIFQSLGDLEEQLDGHFHPHGGHIFLSYLRLLIYAIYIVS